MSLRDSAIRHFIIHKWAIIKFPLPSRTEGKACSNWMMRFAPLYWHSCFNHLPQSKKEPLAKKALFSFQQGFYFIFSSSAQSAPQEN